MSAWRRRLSWYQAQCGEHGVLLATSFFSRLAWSRLVSDVANTIFPRKLQCPCCGWKGWRFYDYIEVGYTDSNTECPRCFSHRRHRALYLWLQNQFGIKTKRGVALVFAPERCLTALWDSASGLKVYKVDYDGARGVDLMADISKLSIRTNSVNIIWCHHVLEHLQDDLSAIKELYRTLKPGLGEMVISVPMMPGSATREYGYPRKEETGHWRMYGDDFVDRLQSAGFVVQPGKHLLSSTECRLYGIKLEPFYVCSKPRQ